MKPETVEGVSVANILQYAKSATINIRPGGTITGWNTYADKIFGYSARNQLDKTFQWSFRMKFFTNRKI